MRAHLTFIQLFGMACVITSCAYPTTKLDQQFGESTRMTMQKQIIDPDAGKRQSNVTSLDGRSAKEAIFNYYESFNRPPTNPNSQSFRVGNGGTNSSGQ